MYGGSQISFIDWRWAGYVKVSGDVYKNTDPRVLLRGFWLKRSGEGAGSVFGFWVQLLKCCQSREGEVGNPSPLNIAKDEVCHRVYRSLFDGTLDWGQHEWGKLIWIGHVPGVVWLPHDALHSEYGCACLCSSSSPSLQEPQKLQVVLIYYSFVPLPSLDLITLSCWDLSMMTEDFPGLFLTCDI